jgi:UDP-glucose 4-epimerase
MGRAVLVTGGTGFLGRALISALLDRGEQVVALSRNATAMDPRCQSVQVELGQLCDYHDLPLLDYQACFHFAGASSVPLSWEKPIEDFANSVPGTVSLIHFLARNHPRCKLLVSSSAAVYGNPAVLPVVETAPIAPISPYGVHKATIEFLCEHYSRLLGLPITILRIFSAYGPGLRKQLLWDTVCKLMKATTSRQGSISLYGTGLESRDFLHSRDVALAAIRLADAQPNNQFDIVNIASGAETQISRVAQLLCRFWGESIQPEFTGEARAGDPQRWVADLSRLSALEFFPCMGLEDGIRDYVTWAKGVFSGEHS